MREKTRNFKNKPEKYKRKNRSIKKVEKNFLISVG